MAHADILVTGATGTTGGAIIRQLAAEGKAVKALVRDPGKAASLASDTISLTKGDLSDRDSLVAALQGIRAAYLNIVPGPEALDHVDNFIAAAKQAGLRHIVKLSGMNASAHSKSAIIRLHAEADRRVAASGLGYTILRANSFYQNILGQIDGIRANGQFYLPLGKARQSLIDVADIAAVAAARLSEADPESGTFDLSGPEALSFDDVAARLGDALGRPVSYVPVSTEAFRDSLIGVGLPEEAAASVAELFGVFAEGHYAAVSGDVAKILGRAPRPFSDFAGDLAA